MPRFTCIPRKNHISGSLSKTAPVFAEVDQKTGNRSPYRARIAYSGSLPKTGYKKGSYRGYSRTIAEIFPLVAGMFFVAICQITSWSTAK